MEPNFGVARFFAALIEIAGWVLMVAAAVYLIAERGNRNFDAVVILSVGGGVAGLLLVAAAQFMRAQIVTAESTQKSEQHLARLVGSMGQGQAVRSAPSTTLVPALVPATAPAPSRAAMPVPPAAAGADELVKTAHGHDIYRRDGKFIMDGGEYHTLTQAENYARRYPAD